MTVCSASTIACAMSCSERGEWTADTTLPMHEASLRIGQDPVFGVSRGVASSTRPTGLRVTPAPVEPAQHRFADETDIRTEADRPVEPGFRIGLRIHVCTTGQRPCRDPTIGRGSIRLRPERCAVGHDLLPPLDT